MMISCTVLASGIFREAVGEYMKYKDPKQELKERIKDLMKRMSLQEKIGQMTQIERMVASPTLVNKYFIGNPIYFFFFFCIKQSYFIANKVFYTII